MYWASLLLILEQTFLCCEPPFENQLWYWHCETVTVSVCSQCCSSDKRYSEWRPAEDAGGDFTARLRLFREPAQQVSATDCAFVHKRNTNICIYLDIYRRQFLDLLHRLSITISRCNLCCVFIAVLLGEEDRRRSCWRFPSMKRFRRIRKAALKRATRCPTAASLCLRIPTT